MVTSTHVENIEAIQRSSGHEEEDFVSSREVLHI